MKTDTEKNIATGCLIIFIIIVVLVFMMGRTLWEVGSFLDMDEVAEYSTTTTARPIDTNGWNDAG